LSKQVKDALIFGVMQFLSWGICTISWRSVAQANYQASIVTDTILSTLNFLVIKKMMDGKDESSFIPWLGYTIGGVLGTVTGIWLSIRILGN
jgi:hypothetical protein